MREIIEGAEDYEGDTADFISGREYKTLSYYDLNYETRDDTIYSIEKRLKERKEETEKLTSILNKLKSAT